MDQICSRIDWAFLWHFAQTLQQVWCKLASSFFFFICKILMTKKQTNQQAATVEDILGRGNYSELTEIKGTREIDVPFLSH